MNSEGEDNAGVDRAGEDSAGVQLAWVSWDGPGCPQSLATERSLICIPWRQMRNCGRCLSLFCSWPVPGWPH